MSDGSSSSGESSPRRFRPRSPGSDTESVTPSPRQGSSTALHPSSFSASSPSDTPLLRQPVGFGASSTPAPTPTYHAPEPASSSHPYYSTQRPDIENPPAPSRHRSSKGKEKEKSKEKSKDVSRKGKRDKGTSGHVVAQHSYPHPAPGHFSPDAHKKKAFRVRSYANDPSAGGSPYITQEGPYGAAYRADVGERVSGTPTPPSHRHHESAQLAQSAPETRPRPSYYRCDYDKLRENTPANRAKQAAAASAAATPLHPSPSRHSVTPHQSYYPPETHHSHSKKRKDTHMYPSNHLYPSADSYHGDTQYTLPTDYFNPAPTPHFEQSPSAHSPSPAPPPREKRHKLRSHHHEQAHQASPAPSQPAQSVFPPPPQPPPQPEAPVRVCRVLTLLIEDKRNSDGESMLTEVRVPLRQVEGGDVGFWADAQEVTEELQKGPSRIDGGAKVYTLRGKYKQYFLRISADGEHVCPPANLKVAPDRTLEIYIEDNPPPAGMSLGPPSSPPRIDRELLTPITDSMTSPSPAPIPPPASHHKRASRSSLFSVEDYPSPEEQKFDTGGYVPSSKKRPRSNSMQSVQSTRSESSQSYLQPYAHDALSPFRRRTPSASMSTASQSRTPSQSSPPPPQQPQPPEPVQTSPLSVASDLSMLQQARPCPQPVQPMKMTTSFQDAQPTPGPSSASGPSPPKKAKLSVPQPQRHTEHSVSPGPSQPGSYPWSHSRSSPTSNEAPATGFAAYANMSAKKTLTSTSVPNPFAQYESAAFSLPTPQSEASTTPASQGNLALPSVTAPIVPPTIPSLSSVSTSSLAPTTMAPSAMTVTPTLSGQASSDLDNAVGKYIRGIIDKEPEWTVFVENRKRVLKVSEQLAQYQYVQRILDRFVNAATPADLEGVGGVRITKAQVMRAFNLPLAWGEQCTETLVLTRLYGPGGTRGEEARVVRMLDEPPAITTKITADKYLTLLREVHGQWTINNPG